MKISPTSNWLLLIPAALLLLHACTSEESGSDNTQAIIVPDALLEIPRPNPAAMEASVAKLLNTRWSELNNAVSTANLNPQARAQAYANFGLVAFGNGLIIPAEIAFKNATLLAPDDARWIYFLARVQESNGALDKAATRYQQVLELRPGDLPTLIHFADVRFEQARMRDAGELYQQALDQNASSAAAHYGLGRIASANDQHRTAVEHFAAALKLQPYADQINYSLGLAWRNLGDSDKAKAYLAKRGSIEPHIPDPLFDQLSGGESRIGGLWTHLMAGSQAFVEGDYNVAVDEFRLATKDHPQDSRTWQSLGMGLKKTGDLERALNAYRQALKFSENNAVVHHELAKLFILKRDNAKAEPHLMQAIKIDPRMLEAHTTLASLLSNTGRIEAALGRYEHALTLDSQSSELAILRAETLIALGRSNDAANALAETAAINPRDANVRMAYGLVLAELGQIDKADTQIKLALDLAIDDNTRGRAHYALGRIQLRRDNASAAISSFATALKFNSEHRAAGLELARAFFRLRDFNRSLGTYEVLIKKWPNNDSTRVEAARAAIMLGDGTKSLNLLQAGAVQKSASARLLGSLARLLVLSTEDKIRNPNLALEYAQRALTKTPAPQHRETLALCQAAVGHFDRAVKTQQTLLSSAATNITSKVRSRMEKNLARYQTKTAGRLPFDAS